MLHIWLQALPPTSSGTKFFRDAVKTPGGEEPNNSQFLGILGLAVVTGVTFLSFASDPTLVTPRGGSVPTLDDALELSTKLQVF